MRQKNRVLFDTSAIIAIIHKEPGFEELEVHVNSIAMSIVSFCETVGCLRKKGMPLTEVHECLGMLIAEIIDFDIEIASIAGDLIVQGKPLGLSLGDRACIATGLKYSIDIYTKDKIWSQLDCKCNIFTF